MPDAGRQACNISNVGNSGHVGTLAGIPADQGTLSG